MILKKQLKNTTSFRHSKIMLVIGSALMASSGTFAQESETQTPDSDTVEVIEVTGIRATIEGALFEKRNADSIVDGISADDLGNFPDLNLGEALQRIPGIQIDREDARRSASISVRGLPGSFAKTTVQGQSIASAGRAGRASNPFGMFDSSIFSGAFVQKSMTADVQSGGLSANVDLRIKSALDRKEAFIVRSGGSYEESTENFAPEFFVSGTKHFADGDVGMFATVAWSEQDFRRDQVLINGYDNVNPLANVDLSGLPDNAVALYAREYRQLSEISKGDRISAAAGFEWDVSDTINLRLDGIYAERNLDEARLNTFIVEMRRSSAQIEQIGDLTFVGDTNQVLEGDGEAVVLEPTYVLNNYDFLDPDIHFEDRDFPFVEETFALYPQFEYESENLKGRVIGTYSEGSNLRGQQQYRMSIRRRGNPNDLVNWNGVSGQFRSGLGNWDDFQFNLDIPAGSFGFLGEGRVSGNTISVNGYSSDLPNLVAVRDENGDFVRDANGNVVYEPHPTQRVNNSATVAGSATAADRTLKAIGTDWEYFFDEGAITSVEVGALYQESEGEASRRENAAAGLNWTTLPQPIRGNLLIPSESITAGAGFFGGELSGAEIENYLSVNIPALTAFLLPVDPALNTDNLPLVTDDPAFASLVPLAQRGPITRQNNNNFTSERESLEAYVMANFSGEDYDIPIRGNVGLRYVESELSGRIDVLAGTGTPDAVGKYEKLLPSINIIYDITEDVVLNFAYYETFDAFDLTEFSPANTRVTQNPPGDDAEIQVGNVDVRFSTLDLKPQSSDAIDIGLAWYNRKGSLIGLNYFYKRVNDEPDRQVICPDGGITAIGEIVGEDGSESFGEFATGALFIDPQDTCRINDGFGGDDFQQNRRIRIEQTVNLEDPIKINGFEFQIAQNFDFLEGFWSHTGITFNYSHVSFDHPDDEALPRVSPNSANLITYYEDDNWGVRLAYNWRDEYEVEAVSTFLAGARTVAARGQFDVQINYDFGEGWRSTLQLFNLTDENPEEYEFVEALNRRTQYDGRTARLTVQKRF